MQIMKSTDNFLDSYKKNPKKIVVYGAGTAGQKVYHYLPRIDYYCDKNAKDIGEFQGVKVIRPEELQKEAEEFYILVCVNKRETTFQSICNMLGELKINAKVFNFYNNIAFAVYKSEYAYRYEKSEKPLKIRLISYDRMGWILTKFALKLQEYLVNMGMQVDIGTCPDPLADINHHIPNHPFEPIAPYNDTLMIAHVDCMNALKQIEFQLRVAKMGVCMSKETMDMLTQYGIPREKLCYVNPGQDGVIKPKKYVLGITHRNHDEFDHRKKIENLLEICDGISPHYFSFTIMGSGWEKIVEKMREKGFLVEYYNQFDYSLYTERVIPSLDYYLFFGYDEGSMGFMDALAAGVKTIVTPQGFHLDIQNGISYACETMPDFVNVLNKIQEERAALVRAVEHYTWKEYAEKHVEIWEYVARRKSLGELLSNKHKYNDGIFSVFLDNIAD